MYGDIQYMGLTVKEPATNIAHEDVPGSIEMQLSGEVVGKIEG